MPPLRYPHRSVDLVKLAALTKTADPLAAGLAVPPTGLGGVSMPPGHPAAALDQSGTPDMPNFMPSGPAVPGGAVQPGGASNQRPPGYDELLAGNQQAHASHMEGRRSFHNGVISQPKFTAEPIMPGGGEFAPGAVPPAPGPAAQPGFMDHLTAGRFGEAASAAGQGISQAWQGLPDAAKYGVGAAGAGLGAYGLYKLLHGQDEDQPGAGHIPAAAM